MERELIGNKHTNKVHTPGCRAVDMMKKENMIKTDGTGFESCSWCHAHSSYTPAQTHLITEDDPVGTEICEDPYFMQLFAKTGCLGCNSHEGVIKMFPDPQSGVPVEEMPGNWWVYFECSQCGYQTAWWKAEQRANNLKRLRAEEKAQI